MNTKDNNAIYFGGLFSLIFITLFLWGISLFSLFSDIGASYSNQSIWLEFSFLIASHAKWGSCALALIIPVVYLSGVYYSSRKTKLSSKPVLHISIIMFLNGILLFCLLIIGTSYLPKGLELSLNGTKNIIVFVMIMLVVTAFLLSWVVYQGLLDIRRYEQKKELKADMVHTIAVAAAAYAFLATALIVAVTVLLAQTPKEQLSQIWVGVLASIATSIVVLSGTYLAGFSDFIVKVNETLGSITGKMSETKSELEKTGKSVTKSVEDAKSGVNDATNIFARESYLLSRQLVTLTTANRVQSLPEGDGRPDDAMLGAGSLHTAVLDAALTGHLASKKEEDIKKIRLSYARAGISGMLGAYLHESASDIVGGKIVTNVDNYANVMTGAAKHIANALKNRKHHNEEQESRSFFLLNTVVSPSHSLNWPWYTQPGKMPLRFAPDFLLRFITEIRYFSSDTTCLHGRLTTCEDEASTINEHLAFPSPPWVHKDKEKKFSQHTFANKYIFQDAFPKIAKLQIKIEDNDQLTLFLSRDKKEYASKEEHEDIYASKEEHEDIIRNIAEEHGVDDNNTYTLVAVWLFANDQKETWKDEKKNIVCGTDDCPFSAETKDHSPEKCFDPIMDALNLKTDEVNSFGTKEVKDRAKKWRLGNSDVEWLWGASKKEKREEIKNCIEKKDWFKAASGILDIVGQIDRAKWTFDTDSPTRIRVRNAQRCLLVIANYLFHKHENRDKEPPGKPLHLNSWFSENLVSSPELAAVWCLDNSQMLAKKCVEAIKPQKKKKEMTSGEAEQVIKMFYEKHFALSGIINLPKDTEKNIWASKLATALKEYAKCIVLDDAQRNGDGISSMLLVQATTGRPWRVAEIAWRHGPEFDKEGNRQSDGDGHLKMDIDDAIVIWCYGHILESGSKKDSNISYPLGDWDKDQDEP